MRRQVEIELLGISNLAVLPSSAAAVVGQLTSPPFDSSVLEELIEYDPAYCAAVLSAVSQRGMKFDAGYPNIPETLSKISSDHLRQLLCNVQVFTVPDADRQEKDEDHHQTLASLVTHSIACAIAASKLAALILPPEQTNLAYYAGLLSNCGNIALFQLMPRGFTKMLNDARSSKQDIARLQALNLGIDHGTAVRLLSRKWGLAEEISSTVWLSLSDINIISATVKNSALINILALARELVRKEKIGTCGDYSHCVYIDKLISLLTLTQNQVDKTIVQTHDICDQARRNLGLDTPQKIGSYARIAGSALAGLSTEVRSLNDNAQNLKQAQKQTEFMHKLSQTAKDYGQGFELTSAVARCWQDAYTRNGSVCVYLADPLEPYVEVSWVDACGKACTKIITRDTDTPAVTDINLPKGRSIEAKGKLGWLFEKIMLDFNVSNARLVPLKLHGQNIAAIVFENPVMTGPGEYEYSGSVELIETLLDTAKVIQSETHLSEQLHSVLAHSKTERINLVRTGALDLLAELASGAAHEMNNPLSVISGRVQMLLDTETDEKKRALLEQVFDRSQQLTSMVSDLMQFARPGRAEPVPMTCRSLIEHCISTLPENIETDNLEVDYEGFSPLAEVYVDPGHISSALANLIENAQESYSGGTGPVIISPAGTQQPGFVSVRVADYGCGMEPEAAEKAPTPFYSLKPAGRKRGMGLGKAMRLLDINNAAMQIESVPGKGTAVTIKLPVAQ